MAEDLIGAYERKRLSVFRQMTIDAFDAVPSGHRMMGLLELDVTEGRIPQQLVLRRAQHQDAEHGLPSEQPRVAEAR